MYLMRPVRHRHGWLMAGLSFAVLLLILFGMYRDTALHVATVWSQWDGGYSHGYLALAISLYLVFHQRKTLAALTPCTSLAALFAVAASSLVWLLAVLTGILLVQTAALLLLLVSIIWVTLGDRLVKQLLLPAIIIAFALPVWSPVQPVLQELTASAVYWLARVFGVPALRLEHVITLPAGQLSINESCSGLSYLLAALTLGVLYGYLNFRALWSRAMVLLLAAAAAIMANILRVFIVVYLAYRTDMQHPLVQDHFNLGWYLFGGLVLVLLVIDAVLFRHAGPDKQLPGGARHAPQCRQGYLLRVLVPVFAMVLLAAGPVAARWVQNQAAAVQGARLAFPQGPDGWSGPSVTGDSWQPVYHGAIEGLRAYSRNEHALYLYIGYYPQQRQGSEVISDLNRISDGTAWYSLYPRERVLQSTAGHRVLEQRLASASGKQRLVWYWYRVAGRDTTSRYQAKALQLLGLVTRQPEATVFALAADPGDDDTLVRQLMDDFLVTLGESLSGVASGTDKSQPELIW